MLAYSLIIGLITYAVSIIYNLLNARSLETVFFIGLRFLFYSTLMSFFLQLSYYLIKNYQVEPESEAETNAEALKQETQASQTEAETETASAEEIDPEFAAAAISNEFEDSAEQGFSALDPEEVDYQQNDSQ